MIKKYWVYSDDFKDYKEVILFSDLKKEIEDIMINKLKENMDRPTPQKIGEASQYPKTFRSAYEVGWRYGLKEILKRLGIDG